MTDFIVFYNEIKERDKGDIPEFVDGYKIPIDENVLEEIRAVDVFEYLEYGTLDASSTQCRRFKMFQKMIIDLSGKQVHGLDVAIVKLKFLSEMTKLGYSISHRVCMEDCLNMSKTISKIQEAMDSKKFKYFAICHDRIGVDVKTKVIEFMKESDQMIGGKPFIESKFFQISEYFFEELMASKIITTLPLVSLDGIAYVKRDGSIYAIKTDSGKVTNPHLRQTLIVMRDNMKNGISITNDQIDVCLLMAQEIDEMLEYIDNFKYILF